MTAPRPDETVVIYTSPGFGGVYPVRYCRQCERRMFLPEDYFESQTVCKFCRTDRPEAPLDEHHERRA